MNMLQTARDGWTQAIVRECPGGAIEGRWLGEHPEVQEVADAWSHACQVNLNVRQPCARAGPCREDHGVETGGRWRRRETYDRRWLPCVPQDIEAGRAGRDESVASMHRIKKCISGAVARLREPARSAHGSNLRTPAFLPERNIHVCCSRRGAGSMQEKADAAHAHRISAR